VTDGPYRYVVHPIYTGFLLLFVSTMVFTRNWLLGALVIGSLMTTRLVREERMMRGKVREEYAEYLKRTGRFVPRLRHTKKNGRPSE
jgi:protein-S-isoprenylcysteine O-methyltransferase Ste14